MPTLTAPDNYDADRAAPYIALLDAFAAVNHRHASLGIHEHDDISWLWYVVADWAQRNGHHIEHYVTTANGRTYEVWNVRVDDRSLAFWPLKIGHLDGKDDLAKKIEQIRSEADRQIQELLSVEAPS